MNHFKIHELQVVDLDKSELFGDLERVVSLFPTPQLACHA